MNTIFLLFQSIDFERMLDKYGLPFVFSVVIGYALKVVMAGAYKIIEDYIATLKSQNAQCEDIRKVERIEYLNSIKENTASTNQLTRLIENRFGNMEKK